MKIDLLEVRLNALASAAEAKLITEETRSAVVAQLLSHIETVCVMQRLVDDAPSGIWIVAELGQTTSAPELHIQIVPGTLHRWREFLTMRGYQDIEATNSAAGFAGPCVVRLTHRQIHMHQTIEALAA